MSGAGWAPHLSEKVYHLSVSDGLSPPITTLPPQEVESVSVLWSYSHLVEHRFDISHEGHSVLSESEDYPVNVLFRSGPCITVLFNDTD